MRLKSIIPVLLSLTCLTSCFSSEIRRTELIGSYGARYDYGLEVLVLKADGTYQQTFYYNDGAVLKNTGRWEYPARDAVSENSLLLEDAMVVDNFHGEPAAKVRKMNWFIGPERTISGRIQLSFNPDLEFAYHKISS